MWNSEPEQLGMHLKISEAAYTEADDRLRIRSVTPHVAGIPFFNLPYYAQDGYRDIPYDLYLNTGSEDRQGRYLRSTFLMRQSPSLWVGGLLDIYGKSGLLVGPAFRFDNSRQPEGGVVWKGKFESGYINDRGDLLTDAYGRTPDRQRAFVLGEINGRTVDGVEIAGIRFKAWDQTAGTVGMMGDTTMGDAFSTADDVAFINVTEVNDAPTAGDVTLANVAEDAAPIDIPFATLLASSSAGGFGALFDQLGPGWFVAAEAGPVIGIGAIRALSRSD